MWHVLGRPQNTQRPHKLFLLGFETAMWHVLGKPQQPQNFRSSFRRPSSLTTLRSSSATFEGVPLAWPWYLPRPHKLFLLGFETAMWHVLGRPQNTQRPHKLFLLGFETAMWHVLGKPQQPQNFRSSFRRPSSLTTLRSSSATFEGVPLAWPWYLPRPHKLFLLGFETAMWHVLGRPQNPQNLRSSSAAFEGVPLAWPWYLPRAHKLFLLGFETAMWHVLGRPQNPQNLRSSFRRP